MTNLKNLENLIQIVSTFEDLISTNCFDDKNAICWKRNLIGDFSEIIEKIEMADSIVELDEEDLGNLKLSEQGQLAREIILQDLQLLKAQGAAPVINLIKNYDRDDAFPFFPTDVYSFHVDRSPIPTHTFLCTYFGTASEIIPNSQAIQKIHVPEIRAELKKLYDGSEDGFEDFLTEHFFDLHYQTTPNALPIDCGIGNLWKLAVDHPDSKSLPCVHRAPIEKNGQTRLLLIC